MELLLHPTIASQVSRPRFKLGPTYIFFGRSGQGKQAAAIELARQSNCQGDESGTCESCLALAQGLTTDLLIVRPEGNSLGIEQVRALHQGLTLTPYRHDSQRFVVIDEAELLTLEAQHALLKLIEEPPPATTIILVTAQLESLLPTIRSRGQGLYFPPVSEPELAKWLKSLGHGDLVKGVVSLADGAPGLARRLAEDKALFDLYTKLDQVAGQLLSASTFERLLLIKNLTLDPPSLLILTGRLAIQARRLAIEQPTRALSAVEELLRHLKAGVSSRPALEALALGV